MLFLLVKIVGINLQVYKCTCFAKQVTFTFLLESLAYKISVTNNCQPIFTFLDLFHEKWVIFDSNMLCSFLPKSYQLYEFLRGWFNKYLHSFGKAYSWGSLGWTFVQVEGDERLLKWGITRTRIVKMSFEDSAGWFDLLLNWMLYCIHHKSKLLNIGICHLVHTCTKFGLNKNRW